MILSGARVITPAQVLESGWVRVDGDRIADVGEGSPPDEETVDLAGRWLVPGYVDMHVHGGGGASFQSGAAEDVRRAVEYHRSRGTTTMLASLVTRPIDEMAESVVRLRGLVAAGLIAGIHLEGPFLSAARCGAHDPALLRDPDRDAVGRLLEAGGDAIAMVTLAPELENGLSAVRQIVDAGVVAAVGHADATYDVTRQAIEAGARVATHLFNGMPAVHHRDPGPVLALLEDSRVVVELIHDGEHLHDSVLRGVFSAVHADRIALVSDSIAASGLGDGSYLLGNLDVVVRNGAARLADGGSLAGSTLTMAEAVRNSVAAGVDVPDAVRSASTTPARALGLDAGAIEVGRPADLLVLDANLEVTSVIRAGQWEA